MIGIVLAGGRASRMGGGDKGAKRIAGMPILQRITATLRPQCDEVVLNANGDAERFASFGLKVVADDVDGQPGPLAGILAGLDHAAAHHPQAGFIVSVPADTPFVPVDLVARLQDVRVADGAAIVCARSGGRWHYTVALWSVELRHDLRHALVDENLHQVRGFIERHAFAGADWPNTPFDPFFNVNTPEDVAEAERIAALV